MWFLKGNDWFYLTDSGVIYSLREALYLAKNRASESEIEEINTIKKIFDGELIDDFPEYVSFHGIGYFKKPVASD